MSRYVVTAIVAALCNDMAHAQDAGGASARSGMTILPRLGLTQTVTDNNNLQSVAKDAALITAVTPGVSISSRTGRIQGTLDYALNGILYTKSERPSDIQQTLSARGSAELVERVLFVDVQASIAQQSRSAFNQQSFDPTLSNPNQVEVASLAISPFLRGRIGDFASVELRGSATETNAKDSIEGDTRQEGGTLRMDGLNSGQLRWWMSASTQKSLFKARQTENRSSIVNLGVRYRPDVDFDLAFNAGPERNDYEGQGSHNSANYGLSASWTPSPRTTVKGDWQHHDYGNGHSISIEHRMARSSLRYSDSQSVSLGNQNGAQGPRTYYELFSLLFGGIADPVQRELAVREALQASGRSGDALLTTGFLAAEPSLSRQQQLSLMMTGVRTTISASLSQSIYRRLAPLGASSGDLAQSARVVMRGANLNFSYRLTPTATASLALSAQQTRGDSSSLATTLHSVLANWTGRLGNRLSLSLGARHSNFNSVTTPYRENAVLATLVQQF